MRSGPSLRGPDPPSIGLGSNGTSSRSSTSRTGLWGANSASSLARSVCQTGPSRTASCLRSIVPRQHDKFTAALPIHSCLASRVQRGHPLQELHVSFRERSRRPRFCRLILAQPADRVHQLNELKPVPGRVLACRGADDAYPVRGDLQRFRKVMRKEVPEPSRNLSGMVDVAESKRPINLWLQSNH